MRRLIYALLLLIVVAGGALLGLIWCQGSTKHYVDGPTAG